MGILLHRYSYFYIYKMNLDLEIEFSKADLLKHIDMLKKQIDDMQLSDEIKNRVMQKLRLDWNYNSNAIEGNKLNYGETVAFLMTGITAKGKPLKDYLDIKGHNEAVLFLTSIVKEERPLMEADIRALHKMILVEPYKVEAQTADGSPTSKMISIGEYKTQANHVQTATGEIHYYSTPEETPIKMRELMEWYAEVNANPGIHPVVVAALFHHKFVEIHPFDDGNGRLSRILMNLILMKSSYPPAIIKMDDRQNYYALLSQADVNDSWPFVEYIAERLESSLQLYLKAAKGEDIDEDEDIDKEIALFKIEIQNKLNLTEKKSVESLKKALNNVVISLIELVVTKGKEFEDLFFDSRKTVIFYNDSWYEKEKEILQESNYSNLNYETLKKKFYDEVEFRYILKGFKNKVEPFNIALSFNVIFGEYSYIITDFKNAHVLEKYYNESVSTFEQQYITKSFVKETIKKIQESLK